MAKVNIELDHNGVADFLCSEPVEKLLKECADNAVSRLGAGHKAYTIKWTKYPRMRRKVAIVEAKTLKAKRANLRSNTILKAVMSSK